MLRSSGTRSSSCAVRARREDTMDNQNKTPQQRRAERQKAARIRGYIRMGAIVLAIVLSILSLSQSCSTKKAIEDLAAQLREKKIAEAQAELQALNPSPSPTPSAVPDGTSITLSFVGDCTLAQMGETSEGSFEDYYARYGDSYFFANVKSIFEGDDLTVANLEGTFTKSENQADKQFTFKANPSHVSILNHSGIDVVNVANNHTHDYGNESYVDTLANLDNAGIGRFGYENTLIVEVQGVRVGFTGMCEYDDNEKSIDYLSPTLENIQSLKDQGAQIIVAVVHWGYENAEVPEQEQITAAHKMIDRGADLVIGHHSHVLQGVECYKGKYIAYSLGNFCFGGNDSPTDRDTIIFQQTFTISGGACLKYPEVHIIPCSISSSEGTNDYRPTPAQGDEATRILDKLYSRCAQIDGGISAEETTAGADSGEP